MVAIVNGEWCLGMGQLGIIIDQLFTDYGWSMMDKWLVNDSERL